MPIFEYRCTKCHRKSSIFWRSISTVDHSKARCSNCGSAELTRLVSKVRVIRGAGKSSSEGDMPGGDLDANMMSELGGLDENDPRSLGRFMRKMASETGEEMGPEFNEIIGRLEKGEDPEKIEQSMGDILGDGGAGDMGGMDDMGGMGGMMDSGMGMPPMGPSSEPTDSSEKASDKAETKAPQRVVRPKVHKSAGKKAKPAKKKKTSA